jgi:hypothetical protein
MKAMSKVEWKKETCSVSFSVSPGSYRIGGVQAQCSKEPTIRTDNGDESNFKLSAGAYAFTTKQS